MARTLGNAAGSEVKNAGEAMVLPAFFVMLYTSGAIVV